MLGNNLKKHLLLSFYIFIFLGGLSPLWSQNKEVEISSLAKGIIWTGDLNPKGMIYDKLVPLGFSKNGKFSCKYFTGGSVKDDYKSVDESLAVKVFDLINASDIGCDLVEYQSCLSQNGIQLGAHLEFGSVPFNIGDDTFSIDISSSQPYQVAIISKKNGKKVLGEVNRYVHGQPRPVAFIKSPFEDRVAIVIGFPSHSFEEHVSYQISYKIFGAHLGGGFEKK